MAFRRTWLGQCLGFLVVTMLWPSFLAVARAQDMSMPPRPPFIQGPELFKPGLLDKRYVVPDLAPDRLLLPVLNTNILSVRPGIELILDHTGFGQDDISRAQVGEQMSGFDVRSISFELTGEFGLHRRIGYKVGIEYNGFDVNPEQNFAITDVAVNMKFPKWRTTVYLGQMREDFVYESVGSIATMPQSERVLSPFASPVNAGIKIVHVLGEADRMTLAYGIFKNDWGEGTGGAVFSGRVTRLVIDDPDRRRFLHLGAGLRWSGGDGPIRYLARPGVDAADIFVDTGEFEAKGGRHVAVEAQYSHGPWSVLAEYASASVEAPDVGNPRFHGFYVLGSWVLTGESRPYDRTRGVVQRIVPDGRWGAPELVVRYANVDLDGGTIKGGRYDRIEAGINWWATSRWKLGMLYGRVWLERFGEKGRTDSLLTRLQWVY